jgi:hypothetical protein
MAQYNFNVAEQLGKPFTDYAQTIPNADRIRLAAYLLGLVNAVQQHADITQDAMQAAQGETRMFDDVEEDDPMDPGYHLHNMLESLADDFDALADTMDEQAAETAMDDARASALAKLTDTEKAALGVE